MLIMRKHFIALIFVLLMLFFVFVLYAYTDGFTFTCTSDTRPMLNPQTNDVKLVPSACSGFLEDSMKLSKMGWVDCMIPVLAEKNSGCKKAIEVYENKT